MIINDIFRIIICVAVGTVSGHFLGIGFYALVAIIRTEGQVSRMSDFKITKCTGEGQGSCKRCSDNGKWNRSWMCFLYKVEGYEGCYCSECVKKIMEGNRDE